MHYIPELLVTSAPWLLASRGCRSLQGAQQILQGRDSHARRACSRDRRLSAFVNGDGLLWVDSGLATKSQFGQQRLFTQQAGRVPARWCLNPRVSNGLVTRSPKRNGAIRQFSHPVPAEH